MHKNFLNSLLILLLLSSFSFAKNDDAKLQKEFGKDLTHAPFFLRFSFKKEFLKDWKDSIYPERKYFLTEYENGVAIDKANELTEAKAEKERIKDRLRQKKEALRRDMDRLKEQLAEEKSENQADTERQKDFNNLLKEQQNKFDQLQQELSESKQSSQGK